MKLGTENKTKTMIAAGLLIVAAVLVVRAFRGGEEAASPTQTSTAPSSAATTAQAPRGATQPGRKTTHPVLAKTLDPTLRFDLLKFQRRRDL